MRYLSGLSGRLLVITILIVMIVEVIVFIPSVSRFRMDYLEERLARAEMAAMALLSAPDGMYHDELKETLLDRAEVLNIVARRQGSRVMIASGQPLPMIEGTFNLDGMQSPKMIGDALMRLAAPPGETVIRVIGMPPRGSDPLEITLDAEPLRGAMVDYGLRILRLSLIISLMTAVVVFIAIRRLLVAPMQRVIDNIKGFQENPEDPKRIIVPKARIGEVAAAERALAAMEGNVLGALKERKRLASLGEALAKISHDLRNMLAAQQLMIDRLETSRDPIVARVMPKIIGTLDRAISLCQRTLDYGRAEEAGPELRQVPLAAILTEVAETLGLGAGTQPVSLQAALAEDHRVEADPEQLYRVLANLMRNAAEAIGESGREGRIAVMSMHAPGADHILVSDTGPGIPKRAQEHLFKPFQGSARRGGTGLGLSIARELVEAHGGTLRLVRTGPEGTEFEICLPNRVTPTRKRQRSAVE